MEAIRSSPVVPAGGGRVSSAGSGCGEASEVLQAGTRRPAPDIPRDGRQQVSEKGVTGGSKAWWRTPVAGGGRGRGGRRGGGRVGMVLLAGRRRGGGREQLAAARLGG
jgi:hypothetical protein